MKKIENISVEELENALAEGYEWSLYAGRGQYVNVVWDGEKLDTDTRSVTSYRRDVWEGGAAYVFEFNGQSQEDMLDWLLSDGSSYATWLKDVLSGKSICSDRAAEKARRILKEREKDEDFDPTDETAAYGLLDDAGVIDEMIDFARVELKNEYMSDQMPDDVGELSENIDKFNRSQEENENDGGGQPESM